MNFDEPLYCQVCSLPIEYCEYMPSYEKCLAWLKETHPELMKDQPATGDCVSTANSKRGGKAAVRDESLIREKQQAAKASATITIKREARNKRKAITIIGGELKDMGIDMKKMAKRIAGRFACGAAVTESPQGNEITVQGDLVEELLEFLPTEFPIRAEQISI